MTTNPIAFVIETHMIEATRRQAEQDRHEPVSDFWRGADAAWARVQQGAAERLARSARRLQVRIDRRTSGAARRIEA